jgi:hypothetical protein
MSRNKWALAVAAGAFTTAFIGGVALAGFQLPALDGTALTTIPTVANASTDLASRTKLKAILDGLVTKGTITQAQEEAILQAVTAAEPTPKPNVPNPKPRTALPGVMSFIGDLTKAASDYLGMDQNSREQFRDNPHFEACAAFCEKYDQAAFDPAYESESLAFFEPMVRRVMARPLNSLYAQAAEEAVEAA